MNPGWWIIIGIVVLIIALILGGRYVMKDSQKLEQRDWRQLDEKGKKKKT